VSTFQASVFSSFDIERQKKKWAVYCSVASFLQNLGVDPTDDCSYLPWNHPHRRRYWYRVVCSRQYAHTFISNIHHIILMKVRS